MKAKKTGRLSMWRATLIVARRDFVSMVMSKMFLLFLLGPLLSLGVMALASVILVQGERKLGDPAIVIMMDETARERVNEAYDQLSRNVSFMPDTIYSIAPGDYTAQEMIETNEVNVGGVLQGTLADPELIVQAGNEKRMENIANLLIGEARRDPSSSGLPNLEAQVIQSANVLPGREGFLSSKAVQFALYILTSAMAAMVLSNLAEEKSNRIIEILATAMPMEAIFAGKLFAMLAGTALAIGIWMSVASIIWINVSHILAQSGINLEPAMGWGAFIALFLFYFASSYLFVGAIYLTIGGIAPTPRDAQTFSMPASIMQITAFLAGTWASFAGGSIPWIAAAIPIVSPYVLVGYAAENANMGIHLYGIAMQILLVTLAIRYGARVFRRRVVDPGDGPMTISLRRKKNSNTIATQGELAR